VVKFKECHNFYDCVTCKYDRGMMQQVAKGKKISWQAAMRSRPALERICRHSLTHRIPQRSCGHDYRCAKCDFDQLFEDIMTPKTESQPTESQQVKGFELPMDRYFHNGHTWARIESGGGIRVGIDDFTFKLLGRSQGLDLPLMGKELDQGRAGWGLKRKSHTADVLAPVCGVITEVNSQLYDNPTIAGREPYGSGWLFMVHTPDAKKAVRELMTEGNAVGWMDKEVETLESMIENVAGPLAADGGYLGEDIFGALPQLGWDRLARTFLKS
jgi:glycine cleavage system H lipoate-binding protein